MTQFAADTTMGELELSNAGERKRFMLFSASTEYAIRAMTYLAHHSNGKPVGAMKISQSENIPNKFLSKILHLMSTRGLVKSVRGPGGGFLLAKPAQQIKLADIASVFENVALWNESCVLGLDRCNAEIPCALHDQWSKFKKSGLFKALDYSLKDLETMQYRKRRDKSKTTS